MSVVQDGNTVKIHYKGTLVDGTEFDSSYTRGTPMDVAVGSGQLIEGFDKALIGMTVGETKSVTIVCDDAYGPVLEEARQVVSKTLFPEDFEFVVGNVVQGTAPGGQKMLAVVTEVQDEEILLDMNHPLAGKDLNFDIEVVEINSESAEINSEQ